MCSKLALSVALALALVGCARDRWPDPPPIDQAQYQKDYQEWRTQQQETARSATKIIGIWPLQKGDTPFGSDATLPIVLPTKAAPGRAGVFRLDDEHVTVIPASGVGLRTSDGKTLNGPSPVEEELALGSVRMFVEGFEDGRRFIGASDEEHPLLKNFPSVETYPVDARWRVAARFDAFEKPRSIRIADVRGGSTEYTASGRLTFRIGDQEQHLTAISFPQSDEFFVMFKDATNATTTYGYRMLSPHTAANGQWTVLDFNVARNPPCAYSRFTTCPLPPAENRLAVAIEAGEKRFPTGQGFSQQ